MAQFTTQGRLKLLFNGEGVSSLLDQKDPFFHYKCRSIQTHTQHRRRLRHTGSSGRIYSLSSKTNCCNAEARPIVGNEDVQDDDYEFENDDLSCFRGLVLDISYRPVNVVCWKRAICLEFMEKADVLEYYAQTVNSPGGSFYIPAVLRVPHLLQVVKKRLVKKILSRKNILFRDNYTCQYKSTVFNIISRKKQSIGFYFSSQSSYAIKKCRRMQWYCSSRENLTIDHVVPIALGGEWKWENLVTACAKCNSKKGQKIIEEANMRLIKVPKAPKDYDILAIPLTSSALKMLAVKKGTPEEWRQYLSRSSSEP